MANGAKAGVDCGRCGKTWSPKKHGAACPYCSGKVTAKPKQTKSAVKKPSKTVPKKPATKKSKSLWSTLAPVKKTAKKTVKKTVKAAKRVDGKMTKVGASIIGGFRI